MHIKIKIINESVREYWENKAKEFNEGDSGLDVVTAEDYVVVPDTGLIGLGIAAEAFLGCPGSTIPTSFFLMPRSSIFKMPIRQANNIGLIDAGYRGEMKFPADMSPAAGIDYIMTGEMPVIEAGTRICQIVAPNTEPITFEIVDELSDSDRGESGFGSTGK